MASLLGLGVLLMACSDVAPKASRDLRVEDNSSAAGVQREEPSVARLTPRHPLAVGRGTGYETEYPARPVPDATSLRVSALTASERLTWRQLFTIAYAVSGDDLWAGWMATTAIEGHGSPECPHGESGDGVTANPRAEGLQKERGIAQIHPIHIPTIEAMGFTWDQMYEPRPNLIVAFAIYEVQGRKGWVHCG